MLLLLLSTKYIEDITRWREDKIHIFEPTCNVLFVIWRLNIQQKQKAGIVTSLNDTPLGSRMKWRMESMSGLVPSKTLSSI